MNSIISPLIRECIYCGTPLLKRKESVKIAETTKRFPDNGETKDHIPQRCLFEGYSEEYKKNRFTVPSCHKCNFEFSQVEQELRDLIGIANENGGLQKKITENSVQSILNHSNSSARLRKDSLGYVRGVEFNLDTLMPSHIKNFKGVFYKTYGVRVPDYFLISVLDTNVNSNFESLAITFLDKHVDWQFSGHEDIFKYKISLIKPDNKGILICSKNIEESVGVLCQLRYHIRFNMTIIATKKTLIGNR